MFLEAVCGEGEKYCGKKANVQNTMETLVKWKIGGGDDVKVKEKMTNECSMEAVCEEVEKVWSGELGNSEWYREES